MAINAAYLERSSLAKSHDKSFKLKNAPATTTTAEDSSAQYQLGLRYYSGDAVTKDRAQAVFWFRRAAYNGHAEAQYDLAYCLEHGLGIARADRENAFYWYRCAAEQGHAEAQYKMAKCYEFGSLVKAQDHKKAFNWYCQAAENGHAKAQFRLALCFQSGFGTKPDLLAAIHWCLMAIDNGHETASKTLTELLAERKRLLEFFELKQQERQKMDIQTKPAIPLRFSGSKTSTPLQSVKQADTQALKQTDKQTVPAQTDAARPQSAHQQITHFKVTGQENLSRYRAISF
jgi:TPR repeat protein